jgi:ribosomal protein S18 acetylase RimI-like enzyme
MRCATIKDLDTLVSLEHACFPEVDWETREGFRCVILSENDIILLATESGRATGYVWVSYNRRTHLHSLCSSKPGFGRKLLAAAEAHAVKHGRRKIHLRVRTGNERAIALYERAGYKRLDDLVGYYGDGVDARCYAKYLR